MFMFTRNFHVSLNYNCIRTKISSNVSDNEPTLMSISNLLDVCESRDNIKIQGWVRTRQRHGKHMFLNLNDGKSSHLIQAVVPRALCRTINVGSAIQLEGQWLPSQGSQQNMEFFVKKCLFIGQGEEQVPEGDNDVLRPIPHLRLKTLEFAAILRLRSHLNQLINKFYKDNLFTQVETPLLSQNDCEGAGEAFNVSCNNQEFFEDTKPYLPVSAQLHLEAFCSAIGSVYTISPAFRANQSITRQHMAEFWMLEVECSFMDQLDQLCRFVEEFLRFIIKNATDGMLDEFEASAAMCERSGNRFDSQILAKCLVGRIDNSLPKITFLEALHILGRSLNDKRPLNKKDEMQLVNIFQGPLFVTHFPNEHKPFYMRRTEDGQYTESFDLLAPFVGELAGGSVREWDLDLLASRIPKNIEKFSWYLDLRKWGYPRSAGFGFGIERLMQSLFGIKNIRDTIGFPRAYKQRIKC